jgi:hypothetical protein
MEARQFFLDTASRSFVAGPTAPATAAASTFFAEDVEAIELYFLRGGQYVDYSANTIKLAVGLTAPAALQTSWTALSTAVTSAITSTQAGGSGTDEIQRVTFSKVPVAGSFALQLPARNVTVSSVTAGVFTTAAAHGLVNGQSVTLTGFSGVTNFANGNTVFIRDRATTTFRASATFGGAAIAAAASSGGTAEVPTLTTPQIAADATAPIVQGALAAAVGAAQIIASGNFSDGLALAYTGQLGGVDFADVAVVNNTLAAAPGLAANLSFNTTEVAALITAGTTSGLRLEVEVSDGTLRQTYATTASIADDIITSTSPIPAPVGPTISTLNFDDGSGGTWTVTIDPNGVLTATKQ